MRSAERNPQHSNDVTVHILADLFSGVVEFLFIIAVYLGIKDYSGINIKFNKITQSYA